MTRISVVAVINENQEWLLLKNDRLPVTMSTWVLPGGKIRENEYPAEAGIREVKEETGIAIDTDDIVYVWDGISETALGDFYVYLYVYFTSDSKVKLGQEHVSWCWCYDPKSLPLFGQNSRYVYKVNGALGELADVFTNCDDGIKLTKWINVLFLQWLFVRLTKHVDVLPNGNYYVRKWSIQYLVLPLTGWWSKFVYVTKTPHYYTIKNSPWFPWLHVLLWFIIFLQLIAIIILI